MKKQFNKKKLMTFGVLGLFAMMLVTGALVTHFATVQADIDVETPIVLEQSLFTFDGEEVLNDGYNHYLLIKGENKLDVEVLADVVITITKDDQPLVNNNGLHLAIDSGGDMHYCWDDDEQGNMTSVTNCDEDYVQYLTNNPDWFDWLGTDATYELSGFESPIINHGGNSWYNIDLIGGTFVNGVITLPGIDPDPGLFASLLVVRADPGLEPGTYTIKVEFNPVV